jgi:hypothetical protein
MLVNISGCIGRAPQSLPQTTDGLPVIEAALAVKTAATTHLILGGF